MNQHCERCGEPLKTAVWLEMDTRTDTYTKNEVPTEYSLGAFPFGAACAKAAQKEHDAAQAKSD
jgi:hypothetical protein